MEDQRTCDTCAYCPFCRLEAIEEERDALRLVHADELHAITGYRDKIANLEDENDTLKVELAKTREVLGALGNAADKAHKALNVIQPFLGVFMKHGALIADCMTQAALNQTKTEE